MLKVRVTMLGVVLAVAAAWVAPPAGAHPWGGYQRDECTGNAPALSLCTTGLHFRFAGDPVLRHGFSGIGGTYTGSVTSRLTYVGGERSFTCDYEDGSLVADSCRGAGEFPPAQTYFVQVCESRDPGSTGPGGSGEWGCFMEHG